MKVDDLVKLNALWTRIYPYLVLQIMESYQRDYGSALELGPFSGGISLEMARSYPRVKITIADESFEVVEYLKKNIARSGLAKHIDVIRTDLDRLVFTDAQFDLVLFRGIFFFLDTKENLLPEVFRVLNHGGIAFLGGGYGKSVPKELIDKIADESRTLNDRLGKKRVSVEQLEEIVRKSELTDKSQISKEGGLWLTIRK